MSDKGDLTVTRTCPEIMKNENQHARDLGLHDEDESEATEDLEDEHPTQGSVVVPGQFSSLFAEGGTV